MKALVVGGLGFIGSEVSKYLASHGNEVEVVDLKKGQTSDNLINDIRHDGWMYSPLDHDLVMVFAAITSQLEFEVHPAKSFKTNVHGLFNVLEACRRSKVPKVFFASSAAAYGESMYGYSKRVGELMIEGYTKQGYFEGVSARFFNVYGPGEDPKGAYRSMASYLAECKAKARVPTIYGDGEQRRDFIHVRDAARIAVGLCEKGRQGVLDVGSGKPVSYNRLVDLLGIGARTYVENPLKHYQMYTKAKYWHMSEYGLKAEVRLRDGLRELLDYYRKRPS